MAPIKLSLLLRAKRFTSGNSFQSLAVFVLKAIAGLSGYLLFALVARQSGPDEFGKFSVYFSLAMMAGTAGSLGQQVFLVKEIAHAQHTADAELESATYAYSFLATFVGAVTAGASFCVGTIWLYPDVTLATAIGGAALTLTYAASQTTLGALRIQNRILLAVASRDLVWRILAATVIGFLPLVLPHAQIDAGVALSAMAGTLLIIVLWQCAVIKRNLSRTLRVRGLLSARWLKLTGGLTLVAVISSADLYIFSIVLGHIVPPSQVGPFFASMKTVEVINLLLMSVSLVIGPNIARAVAAGDARAAQAECNSAIVIQGLPAVVACIAVIALAKPLLSLFDSSFAVHANVLYVLTLGVLVNALSGPTVLMLQLIDLHWRQVVLQGGTLIAALALLPALVDRFGLVGAAYGYVIAKVAWNAAAVVSSRVKIGVDPSCFGIIGSGALSYRESVDTLRSSLAKVAHAK